MRRITWTRGTVASQYAYSSLAPCLMIPYVAGPQLVHLHELAVIGELGDDFVNVIGSPGIRRHDIHEPRALPVERVAGLHDRREVMTVRRKQRNQVTDVVEARLLVVVHEVRNAGVLRVHLGTAELLRNHAGGAHVTAEDAPWMAPDPVTTPSLKGCPAPWSSDASDAGRCRVPRKNPHRAGAQAAPWQVINVGARGQRVCHALPPAPSRTEPMRRGLLTA